MNLLTIGVFAWLLLLASCIGVALASNRLPHDSKPLEEIVESLENSGYVIVEAEIDDGRWEVDAHKGAEAYELHIDAVTGKTISARRDDADPAPPAQAMRLSKLLKRVYDGGYSPILSVEFKHKHGRWELEARKDGKKRELQVEAANGKILSDRADD